MSTSGAGRHQPGAGLRRHWAPLVQSLAVLTTLALGGSTVAAARADIAADRGAGPVVAVAAAPRLVAPPVTLGIPRIGVTSRLLGLRQQRDGTLGVPADPQRAGWYSQGPAPGDPGPAVIVGHVDSYRGPGVFARLDTLRRGDLVRVRRVDGTVITFRVDRVRDYPKRRFPTAQVYRGDGRPTLRLITCGGGFDRRSRRYLANTIVFASLVRPARPTRSGVPASRPRPVGARP